MMGTLQREVEPIGLTKNRLNIRPLFLPSGKIVDTLYLPVLSYGRYCVLAALVDRGDALRVRFRMDDLFVLDILGLNLEQSEESDTEKEEMSITLSISSGSGTLETSFQATPDDYLALHLCLTKLKETHTENHFMNLMCKMLKDLQ